MRLREADLLALKSAAVSKEIVKGHTHDFYNYPARFSPIFVRKAIEIFTRPGDLILDPFMGGGTTLVESKALNRSSIGFDISSLAFFLARAKTHDLSEADTEWINSWVQSSVPKLKCGNSYKRPLKWIAMGYHRNLTEKSTWALRILMEQYLAKLEEANGSQTAEDFLRTVLLKTGQWALDSRKTIPSASKFRDTLESNVKSMLPAYSAFDQSTGSETICVNQPANRIHENGTFERLGSPKLILTSPPYPGIHVMYHRWQIKGRRETPAPFWIANSLDGHGLSHYTMGDRHQEGLSNYFENIKASFSSIAKICDSSSTLVQMIAFSDTKWQLPKYLKTLEECGFVEHKPYKRRLWRRVPNRKWYAQQKGKLSSSNEVVLFHKLKD